MAARRERLREGALAVAAAHHAPEKIAELYPLPVPEAVQWWGGGTDA